MLGITQRQIIKTSSLDFFTIFRIINSLDLDRKIDSLKWKYKNILINFLKNKIRYFYFKDANTVIILIYLSLILISYFVKVSKKNLSCFMG